MFFTIWAKVNHFRDYGKLIKLSAQITSNIFCKFAFVKEYKRTEQQEKILAGMELVYERLIAFKKKMNSELVILKDNKIVRIKP
jgi:hypothetical protein